jgi:DNA adenine methylase
MLNYMGSKARLANELGEIISRARKPRQWFVEPFVGGFNIAGNLCNPRLASDSNPYLISMYKALQQGWIPPSSITFEEYTKIKTNKTDYPPELVAFVGFGCSFGNKWFGGYARSTCNNRVRNFAAETKNAILKNLKQINGVQFIHSSYDRLTIPDNSLIYCDPPYENSTHYNAVDKFDHQKFWGWVRYTVQKGHIVFVSEYTAPDDFVEVFEKRVYVNLAYQIQTDRLFVHESQNFNSNPLEKFFK